MKELSIEDQIYLCKYHDVDSSLFTTIHLNEKEIRDTLKKLKENGLYEQYRNLSDEDYEHIIKKRKNKNRYEKVLNKYKFDKTNKGYNHFKQVLEISDKYNYTDFTLENVYRKVADKQNIKSYIVHNDCKRILENTYQANTEIFEQNGYDKKPTVREFVTKELNIELLNTKSEETDEKVQKNINENIEESTKNDINSQLIADMDNTYVKVSVRTVAEWAYQKRIFRQNVRGK